MHWAHQHHSLLGKPCPWLILQSWNSTLCWGCVPSFAWCVQRVPLLGMLTVLFLLKKYQASWWLWEHICTACTDSSSWNWHCQCEAPQQGWTSFSLLPQHRSLCGFLLSALYLLQRGLLQAKVCDLNAPLTWENTPGWGRMGRVSTGTLSSAGC